METTGPAPRPLPPVEVAAARLAGHRARPLPADGLTRSAVLIALRDGASGPEVLLTQRSDDVRDHKGQVSFPGGVVEADDADVVATALREAAEEVGLDPSAPVLLGRLDDYVTITGYHIAPVVCRLDAFDGLGACSPEIAGVFAFPLGWMADPSHVERIPGRAFGRDEDVLVVPYGERVVWGATARMLWRLLEVAFLDSGKD